MASDDWWRADRHAVAMLIHGSATDEMDERGNYLCGDTLLVLLNAAGHEQTFRLPAVPAPGWWQARLTTSPGLVEGPLRAAEVTLAPRSLALLALGECP